jgi:hypothetical protein
VTLLVKTALPWLNDALNCQSGTVAGPSVASQRRGCQSHERAAAAVGAAECVWSGLPAPVLFTGGTGPVPVKRHRGEPVRYRVPVPVSVRR